MGVFVFVLVSGKVIRDGPELLMVGGVSGWMLLELMSFLVMYVFVYALPLGLLTATLLVLGRMSSQREIVAMKASGLSLFNISIPIFFLAAVGTFLSVGINTYLAPLSKSRYKEKIANVIKEDPNKFIQKGAFVKDFPGYIIYIEDKEGAEMRGLWIWGQVPGGGVKGLLRADHGIFSYQDDCQCLLLTLFNGIAEHRDGDASNLLLFEELPLRLPLKLGSEKKRGLGDMQLLTLPELFALKKVTKDPAEKIQIMTEIQKDIAAGFSVFALVTLAIPLGIKASRKETYANLVLAVILAGAYYCSLIMLTWFDNRPDLRPDLLVWIPNIIFQLLGFFWFWRVNKH